MPTTNSDDLRSDQQHMMCNADLSEFFGGAWDFAPNGTFTDVADLQKSNNTGSVDQGDPNLINDQPGTGPNIMHQSTGLNATHQSMTPATQQQQSPTLTGSSGGSMSKNKLPNLYESLRRNQMMAPMMMAMSPLGGYSDSMLTGGMDWTSPPTMMDAAGNFFPASPAMLGTLDPTQYNMMMMQAARIKRPRMSPFLGGGLGFGMGMFQRPAKMPLSPIQRTANEKAPEESTDARTMPLVLPFSAANNKPQANNKPPPVRLMPAKLTEEQQMKSTHAPPTLEDNIERNLRSFLRDTRDLEWDNVTVVELKRILRQYELNATGKKADLMQRINKIRASYRHLDDMADNEQEVGEKKEKRAESSPETMGSDNGLNEASNMTGQTLDSLFAGALELPPGSELLFS